MQRCDAVSVHVRTGNSKKLKRKVERQSTSKKERKREKETGWQAGRARFLGIEHNSAPVPREWSVSPSSPDQNIAEIQPGAEPSVFAPLNSALSDFGDKHCHSVVGNLPTGRWYPSTPLPTYFARRYHLIRLFFFRVHFWGIGRTHFFNW